MRGILWIPTVLLVATTIVVPACKAPAEFEVISLQVAPPEVTAGETVSVTAEVKNTGGSQGVYTAILTVDGAKVETKEVTIAHGKTEAIKFSLVKDKSGTYQVAVGGISSTLVVRPRMVAKEIELKYDNGIAKACVGTWIPGERGGRLVDFTPPSATFTIKKVRIYGTIFSLYGTTWQGKDFDLEIWDKDRKILYSAKHPYDKFPIGTRTKPGAFHPEDAGWVELEVPDIRVTDKFYVHIYAGYGPGDGLHVGVDDSIFNEHSETTIRTEKGTTEILTEWPYWNPAYYFSDKRKVNWMIRVVGTTMVPAE